MSTRSPKGPDLDPLVDVKVKLRSSTKAAAKAMADRLGISFQAFMRRSLRSSLTGLEHQHWSWGDE